jgi:hypothetical protein
MGEMMLISPQHEIADTLRDMAPHARRLMMELQRQKKYGDFPVMLAFFDLMRRWGADPDPSGALRMVAGSMAEGPEISIEDAIRIRYASYPKLLNLSRLPITNDSLVAIPADARGLALVDTPITDEAISSLLRLQNLSRVNLAGTRITDDGLQELVSYRTLNGSASTALKLQPQG